MINRFAWTIITCLVFTISCSAQSFVQANGANSSGLLTLAFGSNVTKGNLLIVCVEISGGTSGLTATDTVLTPYVLMNTINEPSTPFQSTCLYGIAPSSGANTVTIANGSSGGGNYTRIIVNEFSGIVTSGALDTNNSATGNNGTLNSGNVTTTAARELLFGFGVAASANIVVGAGYTLASHAGAETLSLTEYEFVTTTGTYSATATATPARWTMQIGSFIASSSGTTIQ